MENITQQLIEKGYLIEQDASEIINNPIFLNIPIIPILLKLKPPKFFSKHFILTNIRKIINEINTLEDSSQITEVRKYLLNLTGNNMEIQKECEEISNEEAGEGEVLKRGISLVEYDPEPKKITVDDFTKYFRNRFLTLKPFLQDRGIEGLTSINKIANSRRQIAIIGLVYKKRMTKNKNLLFEMEDLTGRITVVVHKDKKEVFEKAETVVPDEVIAIKGGGSREIIFVNDIIFPDIAVKEKKRTKAENYAIFTSDLHIGSDKFLEKNFLKFIDWLNGKVGSAKQKELAKKVKYFFIVGDVVDGIGTYPGQEKELLILDVREQYKLLAKFLKKIRKGVTIIICPGGGHDAVRIIEPQPRIPKEVAPDLYELENVVLTTNPAMVKIEQSKTFQGFNVLLYHGDSYNYYMDAIDVLRLNNAKLKPDTIIHFLLKKRHLAPIYASTPCLPSETDHFVIKTTPDIVVSGHIHKSGVSSYNGILTISCSCWQSLTAYAEKLGHEPDPCRVPILNLKTGKVGILDFS